MLEIKEGRGLLKLDKSAVLSTKKINELFGKIAILLNPNTATAFRNVVDLTESVFSESYLVETLKGEAIRIANYNVYKRTINFAKTFFAEKGRKYLLQTRDLDEGETLLEISCKGVSILKIKFSAFLPIEFEFLKNELSYEDVFKHYQNQILFDSCEPDEIKAAQCKLQNIIEFGYEGIAEVKNFFEEYIKDFSINQSHKYSWYNIKTHDLKHF